MSAVSGVSASSYAFNAARMQATATAAAPKPPPVNDPDHDGDTDTPGRVDVKA